MAEEDRASKQASRLNWGWRGKQRKQDETKWGGGSVGKQASVHCEVLPGTWGFNLGCMFVAQGVASIQRTLG